MFYYLLKKEFKLILRNFQALLILFAMPTIFILIMSLALKNTYSNSVDVKLKVALISQSENIDIKNLISDINENQFFKTIFVEKDNKNSELLYSLGYDFIVTIDDNFLKKIKNNNQDFNIEVSTKPELQLQKIELLKSLIFSSSQRRILKEILAIQNIQIDDNFDINSFIKTNIVYRDKNITIKPTSVQQSVPTWLVFSMFFILIPISNTFINEKKFGTINRIRTIKVSLFPILIGKILPYYIINQIQVLLMILVGIFIVPLLGGDKLEIVGDKFLIFLVSSFISFASISFALVIANISKTTEEATTFGGLSNVVLAALGGIMVPKFIMPHFMQDLTNVSPMSWALESFLEVFLRAGGFADILGYLINLFIFSTICLIIAFILLKNRI